MPQFNYKLQTHLALCVAKISQKSNSSKKNESTQLRHVFFLQDSIISIKRFNLIPRCPGLKPVHRHLSLMSQ